MKITNLREKNQKKVKSKEKAFLKVILLQKK